MKNLFSTYNYFNWSCNATRVGNVRTKIGI